MKVVFTVTNKFYLLCDLHVILINHCWLVYHFMPLLAFPVIHVTQRLKLAISVVYSREILQPL